MILYLLKATICSGILVLAYKLLLEHESMHRFKRGFLLFAVIFPLIVPLFSLPYSIDHILPNSQELISFDRIEIPQTRTALTADVTEAEPLVPTRIAQANQSPYPETHLWLKLIYFGVVSFLFAIFIKNIVLVFKKTHTSECITVDGIQYVLLDKPSSPSSFLNYLFVYRKDYERGDMPPEILTHELAHTRQGHSFDILFISLVQVVWWFNPFISLLRSAIRLNHEFLADAAVLSDKADPRSYQRLLVRALGEATNLSLNSTLNYSLTKKRFIMMTKKTSRFAQWAKVTTAAVAVTILIVAFSSTTTTSQTANTSEKPTTIPTEVDRFVPGSGATEAQMAEYREAAARLNEEDTNLKDVKIYVGLNYSGLNRGRLDSIYYLMTAEQRATVKHVPGIPLNDPPKKKGLPSNKWMSGKMPRNMVYG